jgi:hypothetical protein
MHKWISFLGEVVCENVLFVCFVISDRKFPANRTYVLIFMYLACAEALTAQ